MEININMNRKELIKEIKASEEVCVKVDFMHDSMHVKIVKNDLIELLLIRFESNEETGLIILDGTLVSKDFFY